MALVPFRPPGGITDRALSALVRALTDSLASILRVPILDGVLVSVTIPAPGVDVQATHGLGRRHRGWFVVRKYNNAIVYDTSEAVPPPDPSLQITLRASIPGTFTLWVF